MNNQRIPQTSRTVAALAAVAVSLAAQAQAWEPGPSFPSAVEGRQHAVGLNVGGSLIALGGSPWENGGDQDGAVHTLAPGASVWQARSPLNGFGPLIHQGAGVDALGRIIVFGGAYADGSDDSPPDPFIYDFIEGDGGFVAPRGALAPNDLFAWCVDGEGRIYSIGGGRGRTASASNPNSAYAERYDALLDSWTPLAPTPSGVADAAAVHDGAGRIIVLGGWEAHGGARTANVVVYDIAANTWSDGPIPDMPVALTGHRAALGADGRVYVVGGESGPANAPAFEGRVFILDPVTGAWSKGPPMRTARSRFALALGGDDFLYAMGGVDGASGTSLVERLYTPPCPVFVQEPPSVSPWRGQPAALSVEISGAAPIAVQWRRDGEPLIDGPAPGGGQIVGAATTTLVLTEPGSADDGAYSVVAMNTCGQTESAAATLQVRTPPAFPQAWTVTNLHPGWALSSVGTSVSDDQEGGVATMDVPPYSGMSRPVVWEGSAASAVDLTPAGSVGGQVTAVANGVQVGWWWWPFQCYVGGQWQTCYERRGSAWSSTAASAVNVYAPGWEYCSLSDTDGSRHTGTVSRDDASGNVYFHAGYFVQGQPLSFHDLQPPAGASNSSANALDGAHEYGSYNTPYPGPTTRAARWSGTGPSMMDMHPAGASRSWISAAGDGQQVGVSYFGDVPHASIWADDALTFLDLTPAGAASGHVADCAGGLQAGAAFIDGAQHAVLWATSPDLRLDLHAFAGGAYTSTDANAIVVRTDGVIRVVGSGYNAATGRTEALLWTSRTGGACPEDIDGDGVVGFGDLNILLGGFNEVGSGLPGDVDGDGDIDFADLNALLGLFNQPCR